MTGIGRFVAGVGAVVLGLVATVAYFVVVNALGLEPGSVWLIALVLLGFAVFGLVTAALYTWSVDGRFVRSRRVGP